MALEDLKHNIAEEREILKEIVIFARLLSTKKEGEKEMVQRAINSLVELMKLINKTIPSLVENISPVKKLGKIEKIKGLTSMSYEIKGEKKFVTINEEDKKNFIRELSLSNLAKRHLMGEPKEISYREFKKANTYARISNLIFSKLSNKFLDKGYFSDLNLNLRKANIPILQNTYVSIMLLSTLLAVAFSILVFIVLIFFKINMDLPFLHSAPLTVERLFVNLLICILVPSLTFLALYFYPMSEKQSIGKKIENELPFATIHMSAIAGSGIEPTQIFKIIALGHEYPYTRQEIRKIINQVNVYGYDLVTSLRNSAKSTSSNKLAELFNGFATTISSGGSLNEFLEKRSETLLFDYRMQREKSTKAAETFMDIYISVVIAAPMIMMILLILINVSNISTGLSVGALTLIIISIVALLNLIFLAFLRLKQTRY